MSPLGPEQIGELLIELAQRGAVAGPVSLSRMAERELRGRFPAESRPDGWRDLLDLQLYSLIGAGRLRWSTQGGITAP